MSDYKIESEKNLELALGYEDGYGHLDTAALLALAQVNATLHAAEQTAALVEQQKLANEIAYFTALTDLAPGERMTPLTLAQSVKIGARIVDGLGIE